MNPTLSWLFAAILAGTAVSVGAQDDHPAAAPAAQTCLKSAGWTKLRNEGFGAVSTAEVLTRMAKEDVVLLGEYHDEDDHHRWQVQTLAGLHALRPKMVIGFEVFPRSVQPVLDRWVAGELTVKQFLERSEWDKVWNVAPELYLPLFQFARINRIPMVALNVDRKLNKAIIEQGWDAVPEPEREGVGRAAPPSDAYRDLLFESYRQHATVPKKDGAKAQKSESATAQKTDGAFRRFVESQTTWDRAMAEAIARQRATAEKPLVVGIMGSGHIRFGHGVPHQLRDLGVKEVGSLLPLPFDYDCKNIQADLADAVFVLPRQAATKPAPPRLGVQLEENDGGVRIAQVTAGGLAERTGLKSGDRLLEVGGLPVKKTASVITAIRLQPSGTWLPMRVQRGDEIFELVVKFPAKS